MANETTRSTPPRRKRRRRGVSKAVVSFLSILALLAGGVGGYFIGRSGTSNDTAAVSELELANKRITQLEVALEAAGVDPADENLLDQLDALTDDTSAEDMLAGDLTGVGGNNTLITEADKDSLEGAIPTAEPAVVAEYTGGVVMSDEVLDQYNTRVNEYMLAGVDVTEYASTLMEDVLVSIVKEKIAYTKAEELGLTTLTDEDTQQIDQEAQEQFESQIAFFTDFAAEDGMTAEEARTATIEYLEQQNGITLDSLREEIESTWWEEKLMDSVTSQIVLSEQDLGEVYDQLVADQQSLYTESLEDYEFARRYGDEIVAYNPEGYRTFKHILLALPDEDALRVEEINAQLDALSPETDADEIDLLNTELDEIYAKLQAEADEVADRIENGEAFDQLIAEYGDDPSMLEEPVKSEGYYVCEKSVSFSPSIVEAAMALENIGDVSEPVRSVSGLHFIQYVSDVPSGAVALDEIRDALTTQTLDSMKYDAYDEQLAAWVEDANIVYHEEALQ